eukprot:TRINITY_DN11347_c0_g1_i1.p1 TRINITY_DN11347_c0_g1~~TRINITY_DN11347_c0_g1_i1.p1  ORF type:complete len:108 (+),score=20.95 TRINITY_DN11347_c0_g1_i1:43-366(+)
MDIIQEKKDNMDTNGEENEMIHIEIEGLSININPIFENYDIIGLETDSPILKLNNLTFIGSWELSLGTFMYFEKDKNDDQLKLMGQTRNRLVFKQIYIKKMEDLLKY